jgi:hypothetical protein
MADLRNNVVGSLTAGVVIGVAGAANRFLVNGVPVIYDVVVGTLGRWGEPVFAVAMGFVLDMLDQRAQFIERYRIPSRWFIYGIYRLTQEAMDVVQGKGFAVVKGDGSIATDPSDTISKVYMQKGDTVTEVSTGSRTATIGIRRFVAVGSKRLYYFEAPYELPEAGGGGEEGEGGSE